MTLDVRSLDNTLPQSAYAWLRYEKEVWIDPYGSIAFDKFVDAYVNSKHRAIPLPADVKTGDDPGIDEPFVRLWQRGALPVKNAAKPLDLAILWEDFVAAVAPLSSTSKWSAWMRFQWSPLIVPAYKARTKHQWPTKWEAALPFVNRALASFAKLADHEPLTRLRTQVEGDLSLLPVIDDEYRAFARRHNVPIATAAIAFAFDWFQRGESYRRELPDRGIYFHDLRSRAVMRAPDSHENRIANPEIPWSRILKAYFGEGLLKRDPSALCDTLTNMRTTVQEDQEFKFRRNAWSNSITDGDKRNAMWHAAARVLELAKLTLPFRDETRRKTVLEDFGKLVRELPAFQGVPVSIVYQVVRVAVGTDAAKWFEYNTRLEYWPETVWRVFRVPAL